ncbi:MAG: SDR family NAD(P)-dependent oxidoreductase [Pseudomonadota bacterium]
MASRTVVVTGAASGIGRALVLAHAERDDQVYALDRDGEAMADLEGKDIRMMPVDVTDMIALERIADDIWGEAGGVDWVYANAGVSAGGALMKATPEQFEKCFAVNVIGVWATLQVFARRMVEAGQPGRLCLTGSEHSLGFQHAGAGIYTASKHAVLGMADVWRHELPDDISMSVLCPGLTATGIGELPDASAAANAFGKAMMAEGLDPAIVARATIEGVERGDFLITTHTASKIGWDARKSDVEAAFDNVPEEGRDVERYAVPAAIQRVRAKLSESK